MLEYSATANSTTTTTVPLHDIIGSTIGLVNAAGSIATTFTYEPFGAVTPSGSATTYPYLFAGMEYDRPTGLYHTLARYYSPRLQRYLSEDPLGFGGGDVDVFAYAGNNPIDLIDPLGMQMPAFQGGIFVTGIFTNPPSPGLPPPPPPPPPGGNDDNGNGPNDIAAYLAQHGATIGNSAGENDVSPGPGASGGVGVGVPFGGAPSYSSPGPRRTPDLCQPAKGEKSPCQPPYGVNRLIG